MAQNYPEINGNRYSWASVEITVDGTKFYGCKSISYKASLKPGKMRGTSVEYQGRTRGEAENEGSIEFYKEEFAELLDSLEDGFLEATFDVQISYSETDQSPVVTDELIGCRITSVDESHSEGPDPLTVKCDLDVMRIKLFGYDAVTPLQ